MKKKPILILLTLILFVSVLYLFLIPNKYYFYSHDKLKCITFMSRDNDYYVIPYKYDGLFLPDNNYSIIHQKYKYDEFEINWCLENEGIKMFYPSIKTGIYSNYSMIRSHLEFKEGLDVYKYAEPSKHWTGLTHKCYPCVESYTLTKIKNGKYLEERKELEKEIPCGGSKLLREDNPSTSPHVISSLFE